MKGYKLRWMRIEDGSEKEDGEWVHRGEDAQG